MLVTRQEAAAFVRVYEADRAERDIKDCNAI